MPTCISFSAQSNWNVQMHQKHRTERAPKYVYADVELIASEPRHLRGAEDILQSLRQALVRGAVIVPWRITVNNFGYVGIVFEDILRPTTDPRDDIGIGKGHPQGLKKRCDYNEIS